jgi:hypothetical protein
MNYHFVFADEAEAVARFEAAHALQTEKRFREAISEYDQVLQLPDGDYSRYARWNKAMALLALGDYQEGFIHHDIAWDLFDWGGFGPLSADDHKRLCATLPRWFGEQGLSNKHLLIYHEMGHGDAIQAARWLPVLARSCAGLTLVTLPPLVKLLRRLGVEVVDRLPENLERYDYRLPCFGVMRALHVTTETVPNAPYIPDVEWRRVRGQVGIVWSGRSQRMFSLEKFLQLFDRRDYKLFALQLGPTTNDVEPMPWSCFDDTARLIEQLEHVVSVDTATVHLAAAMGHPSVHLILPYLQCWRWYCADKWYPRLRLYRQETPDDWAAPFARLNEALHELSV